MDNMSQVLKRWRADYGLTQAHAGQLLSISRSTYNRWENDPGCIPYRERQRAVALLNAMDHAARQALDGIVGWNQVG